MSIQLKRPRFIVTAVVTLVASYFFWWIFLSGDVFSTHEHNSPNRAALVQLRDAIDLGASYSEVLAAYWRLRTLHLTLGVEDPATWVVSTPLEFLVTNWEMFIEFRDGKVTAIRIRTAKGNPPKNGPADKGVGAVAALMAFGAPKLMRYPKLLITAGPHGTQVAFEDLRTITVDINEKSRFLFDGSRLELQAEGSPKRIVLAGHDFPEVDFHALWQRLTDMQRGRITPARGRVAAIGGFRALRGLSNLLFLWEEQSLRPLLLCLWIGFLILGMKKVFG